MAIVQIAKASATSAIFSKPVTAGNAVIVFAGYNNPGGSSGFGNCTDNLGHIYEGSGSLGDAYDYAATQCSAPLRQINTQSFFFFPCAGTETTVTVDMKGTPGPAIIAYEITVPGSPSDYPFNLTSNYIGDAATDSALACNHFPHSPVLLTETFPGPPSGDLSPTYRYGTQEMAFMCCYIDAGTFISTGAGWTMDVQGLLAVTHRPNDPTSDPTPITDGVINLSVPASYAISADTFYSTTAAPPPPPPPLTTCAPVDVSGTPVNGVFIDDLNLFIIPAYALYNNLVPNASIAVNELSTQGRKQIILDFNNNEGLYVRDFGTIFTWSLQAGTILDVWQPSVIPMDGEIYDRLSYHCLMTSLGSVGWQHAREMNIAYAAPSPLTLQLVFDQWPNITLTLPSSVSEIKQKLTLPPNKFKLVEIFISSANPFKLWTNDLEMKIKTWGSNEPYRVARPVSG